MGEFEAGLLPVSSAVAEKVNDDGPGGHADEPGNPNADHQFQGKE